MDAASVYLLLGGAGLLAGFVDAIAGGGGLITLPALLWTGLPPQVALGTNKLQSSCGTSLAAFRYWQAGLMRSTGIPLGVAATFLAAWGGSAAAAHAPADLLRRIIPFLLIAIALYVGLRPSLGSEARPPRMGPFLFAVGLGGILGFYDGFFGPGTGSFWMTACVVLLGLEFRGATGYTKAMNLASNLASLLFFAMHGQVHARYGLAMAAGQLAGAQLGSRMVIVRGSGLVRPMLLGVVAVLAGKLLWDGFAR
ncbi:MAG TPA: hypothetical protein DCM86_02425 [Verrucomicrobiales bacterium]|nr:hypothetical protein [Verrucomicrobiales bacterium]